jgi:mannose-1-phosphate guanylyltransferase/phosphomannomutase
MDGYKKENTIIGEGTNIETDARNLSGTSLIGKNCHIHSGAVISNAVIGDNCEIASGVVIRNSVIWKNTKIGTRSELTLDVVGNNCILSDDVVILENVFIGDSCTIGRRSKLLSNIKIWPGKSVEEGSIVTRSLVWEDRWLRDLFTDARVTGISNVEISPEFGAKLGAAFGAFVGGGASVVTSRDSDNVSRMINRAIMSGLMSAGLHCVDLRVTSIPIVRHELRTGKERGGIHVRKSPFDISSTDIIFFDAQGKDLPSSKTKSIERLFFGEDFSRAHHGQVGAISFPERTTESYIQRFLETISTDAIHSSGLKLVIDYSNGIASTIFPNILGNLDIQVVALNAYLDSRKLTRTKEEFDDSLRQLAYVVTSLKYDVGCMLDAGAERIFVIDERGNIIDSDRLLSLMVKFLALTDKDFTKLAIPISASGEVSLIAKEFNLEVVKTRDSHLALMEAAIDKQIKFVGGTKGGFIFNEFLFASDGMYSIAKLLESIAKTKKRIGELDKETPRLHFVKKNISCPWHMKGRIMRKLTELSERIPRDLIEGIKLYPPDLAEHTSVLLNPDRARPMFHINAESSNIAVAQNLANEYENRIQQWIDGEQNGAL